MRIPSTLTTPLHLPPPAVPQVRPGKVAPLRPVNPDNTAKGVAEDDREVAGLGEELARRSSAGSLTGFRSQTDHEQQFRHKLGEELAASQYSRNSLLRKRFEQRQGMPAKQMLELIMKDCRNNPYLALEALRRAADEAQREVPPDDPAHEFFSQHIALVNHEYGYLPKRSTVLGKIANPPRAEISGKKNGKRAIYSTLINNPLSVVALVDALINEVREHGDFEHSLSEIRSELAADLASAAVSNVVSKARPQMKGMATAKDVATLLRECEHLLGRMRTKNPGMRIEALALLKHMLTLMANTMEQKQTRTLIELLGGKVLRNQMACLNEIRRILQYALPVRLWPNKDHLKQVRDNLVDLSTTMTKEEQQLAQESRPIWNV